jgi:hypothetical protein
MKTDEPQTQPQKTIRRRSCKWLRRIGIVALLAASALTVDYLAYPYGNLNNGRSGNIGENGLWLRYTWYFGEKSKADLTKLPQQLKDRQIRYAWFHVRYIRKDGSLRFHYPENARLIVDQIHRQAPDIKVMAWVYAGNKAGLGDVDLSNTDVRKKMVQEAKWLVTECGFDGVQWDYEICPDAGQSLLALLRETRLALPPGKLIGAATPIWVPAPFGRWGWSDEYFRKVAGTCDQIAVMGYDSGFWLPRSYVWLIREQVSHATQAAAKANPKCRVLIGVPTYGPAGLSHNIRAENLGLALKGIREAMTNKHANLATFAGVAIFADYTTDNDEWRQ